MKRNKVKRILSTGNGNGPDDDNPGRRNDGGSFRGNIGTGI